MRKSPPVSILGEVKRYDPALRIRWSLERKRFCLERKTDKRFLLPPIIAKTYNSSGKLVEIVAPADSERYIQWRDGYTPILYADKIDRRIMWHLFSMDSYRFGKRFIKHVENTEKEVEEKTERRDADDLDYISGQVYDRMRRTYI